MKHKPRITAVLTVDGSTVKKAVSLFATRCQVRDEWIVSKRVHRLVFVPLDYLSRVTCADEIDPTPNIRRRCVRCATHIW